MLSRPAGSSALPLGTARTIMLTGLLALASIIATASDEPDHTPGVHDPQLRECYQQMLVDPARSVALAQSILADPDHTLVARIRALACLSGAEGLRGEAAEARTSAYEALELIAAQESKLPDTEIAGAYSLIANALAVINDWSMAMELSERSLDIGHRLGNVSAQIAALSRIAHINIDYQDDPEAAAKRLHEAITLASATQQRGIDVLIYNLGYSQFQGGLLDEARGTFESALALIRTPPVNEPRNVSMELRTLAYLAAIKADHGQPDQAMTELSNIIQQQTALPDAPAEATSRVLLGGVLLDQGRAQEALAQADKAIELARRGRFHREHRDALSLRARALADLGHAREALDARNQAHQMHVDALVGTTRAGLASMRTQIDQNADDIVRRRNAHLILLRNILIIATAVLLVLVLWLHVRTRRELSRLRKTDPLTGLLNRDCLTRRMDVLSREIAATPVAAHRSRVMLLVQMNQLTAFNTRFGIHAGDDVLRTIADRLRDACGPHGIASRWTGDQFLVVVPGNGMDDGRRQADRLLAALTLQPLSQVPEQQRTLSIAMGFIGCCPFFPGDSLHGWRDGLPVINKALCAARHAGRNVWVGIWGTESGSDAPLRILHGSLAEAHARGWIEIATSAQIDHSELRLDQNDRPDVGVMHPMHHPAPS